MILHLDENNKLQLTEKALMIETFSHLYKSYGADKDLAMSAFAMMYFMYNFDSNFLTEHKDESKRLSAVRKFIHRGSEVKITRTVRKAMDIYKQLYNAESGAMYLVMRDNVRKLKEYARIMVLISPLIALGIKLSEEGDPLEEKEDMPVSGIDYVLVESKEFVSINSMLPKQQKELDEFEVKLMESLKNKIDIFGGGKLGAYEQ